MKVYFFPGLGADSSLAPFHYLPGLEVHWIEWPKYFGETWDEFIAEIRKKNAFEPGSIYAGISFGGLVAQRMASETGAKGIILIGSFSDIGSIAWILRSMMPLAFILPPAFFRIRFVPRILIRYYFGIRSKAALDLFRDMAEKLDGRKTRDLIRFIAAGAEGNPPQAPILRIHGSRDRILPIRKQRVDLAIEGAGHFISMTDSPQVNARILEWIEKELG
ncbi:MAG: hypothetical protein JWP91_4108 [Fibrobacteres bacterium]|nr:hypothetical protein [Fibrobacterota bacterium]